MNARRPRRYCRYQDCEITDLDDISMHRFPKDEELCKLWVAACGNEKLHGLSAEKLNLNARICAKHFSDWCFINGYAKQRLVHDAVPGISTEQRNQDLNKSSSFNTHKIVHGTTNKLPDDWCNTLIPDEPCTIHVLNVNDGIHKDSETESHPSDHELESSNYENTNEIDWLNPFDTLCSSSRSSSNDGISEDHLAEQSINQNLTLNHESELDDYINTQEKLKFIFQDLNKRLTDNPSVYKEPVKKFFELYKKCKTESAMVSALHTFGAYNGMSLLKKGKNLQGRRIVRVQPTAVARRKIKFGRSLIRLSGKTPKTSYINEHDYIKRT